jgi:hypothetical protein
MRVLLRAKAALQLGVALFNRLRAGNYDHENDLMTKLINFWADREVSEMRKM